MNGVRYSLAFLGDGVILPDAMLPEIDLEEIQSEISSVDEIMVSCKNTVEIVRHEVNLTG